MERGSSKPGLSAKKKALLQKLLQQEGVASGTAGPRIERRAESSSPLTPTQERVWLLEKLGHEAPVYHVPAPVRLEGPLDTAALSAAIDRIFERHEILRSVVRVVDERPRLVVQPARHVPLPIEEIDGDDATRWSRTLEKVHAEYVRPFDLVDGPLLRARLFRLDEEDHVLLLSMHHVVCDGVTIRILFDEIRELYDAAREGRAPDLPEADLQFGDYAAWMAEHVETPEVIEQVRWWSRELGGELPALELGTDRPRRSRPSGAGAWLSRRLRRDLDEPLRRLAAEANTTLFTVFLAAFQVLLNRYTRQEELLVGIPVGTRDRVELERMPGFFVNTLAVRGSLAGDPGFTELVRRVRDTTLAAFANQEAPFERVVDAVRPDRRGGRTPVFQAMFDHRRALAEGLPLSGLRASRFLREEEVHSRTTKVEVALYTEEFGGDLWAAVEYDTELFDETTMRRLLGHFEVLLESVAREPDARIADLRILGENERHELLVERNDTSVEYPAAETVHGLIGRRAEAAPDAVAVELGEHRISYRELVAGANRLAHHLQASGVSTGQRVAICLERSPDQVTAMLAVLAAGAAYVPLDPAYPRARLDDMLADSGARVLITRDGLAAPFAAESRRVVRIDAEREEIAARPDTRPPSIAGPDDPAYVVYTSGSTGRPKGVVVPHRGVLRLMFGSRWLDLGPTVRMAQLAPFSFDASILDTWGPLLHGGCVVPYPDRIPTIEGLRALIRHHRVDTLFLTTALFHTIVDEAPEILTPVRQIATGGEALSRRHVERALELLPHARITNCYGPTEVSVISTFWEVPRPLPAELATIPIGRPIANTTAYVVDARGNPVPIGVPGELWVGGPGVALGYSGRADATAERFLRDPFSTDPKARVYRTGDLVRWLASGDLEFLGRLDEQVKIRGHRIEPTEIEAVLGEHPAVRKSVVVARASGGGAKRLIAYVEMAEGNATPEDVRAFLRDRLPEPLVPSIVVRLERLPTTPGGKIDRDALPDPAEAAGDREGYCPPRGPVEESLAKQWAEVLETNRVGIHDDFFAAGGHSLQATVLIARIRSLFGVDVSLRAFFQAPTIAELAERIERLREHGDGARPAPEETPAAASPPDEAQPVSLSQRGLWYLQRLAPASPFYNVAVSIPIEGRLDEERLIDALRTIVRRHDALRTVFETSGDEPRQLVRDFELDVERHDLSAEDASPSCAELQTAFANRPFDLDEGPLFRAALVRLGERESELWVNVHHIVFDGWSMDLLARELAELYDASVAGRDAHLPELALPYREWARRQRASLGGERWSQELAFWRTRLAGAPTLLELPTDRPRPRTQSWEGDGVRHPLPADLTELLRRVSAAHGSTVFLTLLAVTEVLLQRYSNQDDFVVGTPVAGRTLPESQALIGLFLNVVALRSDVGGDPTFTDLLRRVRETTVAAHEHQSFPFDALVEALGVERTPGATPIYQVLYSFRTDGRPARAGGAAFDAPREIVTRTSKTDLAITVEDDGERVLVDMTYDTHLFERSTIERMSRHLERLLRSALEEPERPISELELLTDEERRLVLEEWNGPRAAYPHEASVVRLFEEQADRTPSAVALTAGHQTWTYDELDRRANRIARFLRDAGVQAESRVAICLDRGPDLIAAVLGTLKAGGAYVPLDPSYPADRLAFMLEDSGARVLLVGKSHIASLPRHGAETVCMERREDEIRRHSDERLAEVVGPDGLAYVMYTSGSTGRPKGVEIPHQAILRLVFGQTYTRFGPDVSFLQLAPISFDASTLEIWGPLLHGGRLVLYPGRIPTADELARVVREGEVTSMWLTAALFNALVDEDPNVLSGVDEILTGGEALSVEHVKRAYDALPGVHLVNGYGPTENTTFTCCYRIPRELLDEDPASIPIGHPIANTTVYVLDGRRRPVPPGLPGELYTGGAGLARSYLNRPDLTAERFVPNPFGRGRLYRTGDVVRHLPDGRLEFLGRNDFQVKVRGFRIELGEIETTIARHPDVEQVVVDVSVDDRAGKRLVAWVVPREGATCTSADLAQHVREHLPDFMHPAAWTFLDALPITANGKVDRRALPIPVFEATVGGKVLPRNEFERHLAAVWERVLEVADVGVHDDFFDLGGHSLLAVKLLAEVRDAFGQDLPLSSLIDAPTIASQAIELHKGVGGSASTSLVKLQPRGDRTPVFCVCSLGGTVLNQRPLAMGFAPDRPFFGLQALHLESELGRPPDIEDYARRYIEVIRQVHPEGPYVIGGHSFGGVVSYEIAQQLTSAGHEVRMLFILDSALPNLGPRRLTDRAASLLACLRGLPYAPGAIATQIRSDPGGFRRDSLHRLAFAGKKVMSRLRRKKAVQREARANRASDARPVNGAMELRDIVEMTHWPENNRRIAERHYRAVLAYEPAPYAGKVTLFRSRFQSPFLGLGFQMGWDRVARGGVDVVAVPGGHLTLLRPPNVNVLAAKMREALER